MKNLGDRETIRRYGYYYDYLQEMGEMGIDSRPTIKKLKLSRGTIQQAYKEMNERGNKFMGDIIDYLEWVSANFFIWSYKKTGLITKKNNVVLCLRDVLATFYLDFINTARLYEKNEQYITDLLYNFDDAIKTDFCKELDYVVTMIRNNDREFLETQWMKIAFGKLIRTP